jgi:hypothetical protein
MKTNYIYMNTYVHVSFRLDPRDMGWEGVDRIHLAQDRDQWRAVVKTVMNLLVP